jgi:AcrR family transcriptional regulator
MEHDPIIRFPMTRRAVAKQQTRRRLIAAAKQLASERGYEAATLRDMAARANLSTGAVFANFEDKADLFSAAIIEDDEGLLAAMKRAAEQAPTPRQALIAMLTAALSAQEGQLPWVRVKMSFVWTRLDVDRARPCAGARLIENALAEVVRDGVQSGALSPAADADLVADMAWDAYLGACRHAVFDGWTPERLRVRLIDCIDALLDGFEVRPRNDRDPSWPANAPLKDATLRRALRG